MKCAECLNWVRSNSVKNIGSSVFYFSAGLHGWIHSLNNRDKHLSGNLRFLLAWDQKHSDSFAVICQSFHKELPAFCGKSVEKCDSTRGVQQGSDHLLLSQCNWLLRQFIDIGVAGI